MLENQTVSVAVSYLVVESCLFHALAASTASISADPCHQSVSSIFLVNYKCFPNQYQYAVYEYTAQ